MLDFMKLDITKTNIKYNNYSGLPFEIQFLKAIKEGHGCLRLLNPLMHLARWRTKTMPSENRITEFWQATHFSTKNPISKPVLNNRRLLLLLPVEIIGRKEKLKLLRNWALPLSNCQLIGALILIIYFVRLAVGCVL